MKILFIAPRFHTNMIEWVRVLQKNNHEIFINTLISHETEDYSLVKPKKFRLSIFSKLINLFFGDGGENLKRGFPNVIEYLTYFRKIKPEVIVVRDLSRWFSILVLILSKFTETKLIVYSQNKIHNKFNVKRRMFHNIICFLFNPAFMSPIKGDKPKKLKILKNTFYVPFAARNHHLIKNNDKYFTILMIGKFIERKNHLSLIEIIKKLKINYPLIRLIIIGEAYEKEHFKILKKIISQINLLSKDNFIQLIINIQYSEVNKYYSKADLFVLPSTEEPASISILEALANQVPVICSNTCGTSEYIDINNDGTVFKDNNMLDLQEKIKHFIDNTNSPNRESLVKFQFDGNNFYLHFQKMLNQHFNIKI